VAVVIVNYNTCALLRACLRALEVAARVAAAEDPRLETEALVVDNASHDGSAAMVRAEFPNVRLLASAENLGFTRANNLALRTLGLLLPAAGTPPMTGISRMAGISPAAGSPARPDSRPAPDFVWLLNPDTEPEADALARLVRFLLEEPRAAACGPRLRYGDGRFQHGAFAWPGVAQVALDLLPLHRLPGMARVYGSTLNGRYPMALWTGERPFPVDFVLGAAMLVRGEALRALGGLDEGYFMYCEEMDWCLRAHEAGRQVWAVPAAQVVHHEGQSSRQVRWRSVERLWRSRMRFYGLHRARFGPGTTAAVRALLRLNMAAGIASARRRFGRGSLSGLEAGEEIAARRVILSL